MQAYYDEILTTIADQVLAVPVTGAHDLAVYNADRIESYSGSVADPQYVQVQGVKLK